MSGQLFQWFSLVVGVLLIIPGAIYLYDRGDWALLMLSMLIIAFSLSGILKKRSKG